MKAIYLEKPGEIVEKDVAKPQIEEDEILVETKSVGICGSDTEYYESGRIGEFLVEEPIILGHEVAGLVVEVGEGVEDLEVGERVALEPGIPCRKCKYCKSGRYNLCPDVDFMATPPSDGAFAEYLSHPADFAFKLPESISYDEGALVEPLSVGVHAARRANVQPGDRVAILGAGSVGLATLQVAIVRGASEIIITDLVDFRLEKAMEFGATEAINVEKDSIESYISSFNEVIQTAGAAQPYKQALELVERGGKVVQVGFSSSERVSIKSNLLITREVDMLGSFRYVNTYSDSISMLAKGQVDLEPMISKYFPPEEVEAALLYPKENPESCIKAMVKF